MATLALSRTWACTAYGCAIYVSPSHTICSVPQLYLPLTASATILQPHSDAAARTTQCNPVVIGDRFPSASFRLPASGNIRRDPLRVPRPIGFTDQGRAGRYGQVGSKNLRSPRPQISHLIRLKGRCQAALQRAEVQHLITPGQCLSSVAPRPHRPALPDITVCIIHRFSQI